MGYPVVAFTYILLYKDLRNLKSREQAEALLGFFWWAVHKGQGLAPELEYAPLSPAVVEKVEVALRSVTYQCKAVLPQK